MGLWKYVVAFVCGLIASQPSAFGASLLQSSAPVINEASAAPPGLSQTEAPLHGSGFLLTVNGRNFDSGSVIHLNGAPTTTFFGNSEQLTGLVPPSSLRSTGPIAVTVVRTGVASNAVQLHVIARGDINHNGAINIGDALALALRSGGLVPPPLAPSVGDFNLSGAANIGDALMLALISGGVASNFASPTIEAVSPNPASPGAVVTITGTGFSAEPSDNLVSFSQSSGAVRIVPSGATTTTLTVTVPSDTVSGPIQAFRVDSPLGGSEFPLLIGGSIATPLAITGIKPSQATRGSQITLTGLGFHTSPSLNTVRFLSAAGFVNGTVQSAASTQLTVVVPVDAVCGPVSVTAFDKTSNARMLQVDGTACPLRLEALVGRGGPGDIVVLEGSGFSLNPSDNVVLFEGSSVPATVVAAGRTQLHVVIPTTASDGAVMVAVAGSTSNSIVYRSSAARPMLGSVEPAGSEVGTTVEITLTGAGFVTGATTLTISGGGVVTSNVAVINSSTLKATLHIDLTASATSRSLIVTTPSGSSGSIRFGIAPPPITLSVTPSIGVQGTVTNVTLSGSSFVSGETTVTVSGAGVSVKNVAMINANAIVATLHIDAAAPLGSRSLSVTTSGRPGGSVPFSIGAPVLGTGTQLKISTIAGSAQSGSADGIGPAARFNSPNSIWGDGANLYVTDRFNHLIRKIVIATGVVSTIAGSAGNPGSSDGIGSTARFSYPAGIWGDGANLFVADSNNRTIRKVAISTGSVTTIAGSGGTSGPADGIGTSAAFGILGSLWGDGTNLFIGDGHSIRKMVLATGAVTTLAGKNSEAYFLDGTGTAARFYAPSGLWGDGSNLYVADQLNTAIRKIVVATGAVTTLVGRNGQAITDGGVEEAQFSYPYALWGDATNLYVLDGGTVRKVVIATGEVTTLAGGSIAGVPYVLVDGIGREARLTHAGGFWSDGTYLYIADSFNNAIRRAEHSNAGPAITSVSPGNGRNGSTIKVTLTGSNFVVGATTVEVNSGYIKPESVSVLNSTTLTADFVIGPGIPTNRYDVSVATAAGSSYPRKFGVNQPTLTSVTPSSITRGQRGTLRFTGTSFSGQTLPLIDGVIPFTQYLISDFVIESDTTMTMTFLVPSHLTVGEHKVALIVSGLFKTNSLPLTINDPPAGPVPPVLTNIAPAAGIRATTHQVTLTGSNFFPGTTVAPAPYEYGISIGRVEIVDASTLKADLSVWADAVAGPRRIVATNGFGTSSSLTFMVDTAASSPVLDSVSPPAAVRGAAVDVVLTGSNFLSGSTSVAVSGTGITITNLKFLNSSTVSSTVVIDAGAALGSRAVTVTTSNGTSSARPFSVTAQARPSVESLAPTTAYQGFTSSITLTGTGFVPNATTLNVSGSGVVVNNVSVLTTSTLVANIAVEGTATTGSRMLAVSTGSGTSNSVALAVNAPAAPTLDGLAPQTGIQGILSNVTLTGSNFAPGVTTVSVSGTGIVVSAVQVTSNNSLIATLLIQSSAPVGVRDVSVTTPAGSSATRTFSVIAPPLAAAAQLEITTLPVQKVSSIWGDGTNLYLIGDDSIRKYVPATGVVTVLAGSPGVRGFIDGAGTAARFQDLTAIWGDGVHLYVSDFGNSAIRRIGLTTGVVSTLASVNCPRDLSGDGTNLYVVGSCPSYSLRKIVIQTGEVTTMTESVSGTMWGDSSHLYVRQSDGIRKIVLSTGQASTLPGTASAYPLWGDGTNLYVRTLAYNSAGSGGVAVALLAPAGEINLLAGGFRNLALDGTGWRASIKDLYSAWGDGAALYISDNGVLRKATANVSVPMITGLSPSRAARASTVTITVSGRNFVPGQTRLDIHALGITATNVALTGNSITAVLDVGNVPYGSVTNDVDVTVTTPNGTSYPRGLTILQADGPRVTKVTPGGAIQGKTANITINGSSFLYGGTSIIVQGGTGVTVSNISVVSNTTLTATFTIDSAAAAGARTVFVANSSGNYSNSFSFDIFPNTPPSIATITPAVAVVGYPATIAVTGDAFISGDTVIAVSGTGVTVTAVSVLNSRVLTADVSVASGSAPGLRSFAVTTSAGTSSGVGFMIAAPAPPSVSSVNPPTVFRTVPAQVIVTGSGFIPGVTTATISGTGVTVTGMAVLSGTALRLAFLTDAAAPLGSRNVTVSTPLGTGSTSLSIAIAPISGAVQLQTSTTNVVSTGGIWGDGTNLYITDGDTRILKYDVSAGNVTPFAGSLNSAHQDGFGTSAAFSFVGGMWGDGLNLYVADAGSIRAVRLATAEVRTIASNVGGAYSPSALWGDGANLYMTSSSAVWKIVLASSEVSLFAGSTTAIGSVDGVGTAARFRQPLGIWGDGVYLYVADTNNNVIRRITIADRTVTTLAGAGFSSSSLDGVGTAARFSGPMGIWGDGVNLYVNDSYGRVVRKVVISTAEVTTMSGLSPTAEMVDGTGPAARHVYPLELWGDGTDLWLSDNGKLRMARANFTAPVVSSVTPSNAARGATVYITLNGANFEPGTTITVSGTGITVTNIAVTSPATLTATFAISSTASSGIRTITVATPKGTSYDRRFTVDP